MLMNRSRIAAYLAGATFLTAGLITYRAYAAAGQCGNCLVKDIYVESDGWTWIGTGLNMNNGLGCASGNAAWMAVDSATAAGKAALAVAQTALLSGRRVDMNGKNNCTGPGNVEVLSTIWILP